MDVTCTWLQVLPIKEEAAGVGRFGEYGGYVAARC